MIVGVGVGIDVAEIERFSQALRRTPVLAEQLFTERERGLSLSHDGGIATAIVIAASEASPCGLGWF